MPTTTIDPDEVEKFDAMAAEWWDPNGKFKPLHMLNPVRLDYVLAQLSAEFDRDMTSRNPLSDIRLLDIGCGGGLLSEPIARLGCDVVGADAAEGNIAVAQLHASNHELTIDYRNTSAEALADQGEVFDAVLAMEIIEHVADPSAFLQACASLLKPGGVLIASTLNRTVKSYGLAILGAERLLRWLPPGTHDWSRFVTPDEFYELLLKAGLDPVDKKGFVFNPVTWDWRLSESDLSTNYVLTAIKPA